MTYEEKRLYLNRYREAVGAVKTLREEIEMLRTQAEHITPTLSLAPGGGGNNDKMAAAVERITEMQERLTDEIYALTYYMDEVETVISTVKSDRARTILRRRYILCQRWEQIAYEMHLDYSWLHKLHKAIVQSIEISP